MNTEIIEMVKTFLTEDDWKFTFNEEHGIFQGRIGGLSGKIRTLTFSILIHDESFTIYHSLDIGADENVRDEVLKFLMRANYGLRHGCFEMDLRDGEIRYRHNISLTELRTDTKEAMENATTLGVIMITRYGNGLLDVIFRGKSAEDAITEIEDK